MTPVELEKILLEKFPSSAVKATDLTGGGDHWQVTIEAPAFHGLSLVQQHQLVYRALGDLMRSKIHALSLTTRPK